LTSAGGFEKWLKRRKQRKSNKESNQEEKIEKEKISI